MLKTLTIENFKKFPFLTLPDLAQINLFVGVNDVGKTSVLEAAMGFSCGLNTLPLQQLIIQHRLNMEAASLSEQANQRAEAIYSCFHDLTQNVATCALSGDVTTIEGSKTYKIKYTFKPGVNSFLLSAYHLHPHEIATAEKKFVQDVGRTREMPYVGRLDLELLRGESLSGPERAVDLYAMPAYDNVVEKNGQGEGATEFAPLLPAYFNDILGHRWERGNRQIFAKLSREGKLAEFCEAMNQSFPDLHIQEIANVSYPDGSQAPLYLRLQQGGLRPLYTFGDGVRRWFTILGNMVLAGDGIQCIEEADATFHHAAQRELTRNIYRAFNRYHTQLFMTTHSEEFLGTFLGELANIDEKFLKDSVRVITLREVAGNIRQRTMLGTRAWQALQDGLELRQ